MVRLMPLLPVCPCSFGKNQYRPENEYEAVAWEEQVKAVGTLIAEGKVRHWGLSNETAYGVTMMHVTAHNLGVPPPISIQVQRAGGRLWARGERVPTAPPPRPPPPQNDFSLLDRRFESGLAEACAPSHCNLGLLPYGPLAGGTLTAKYTEPDAQPDERARHVRWPDFQASEHASLRLWVPPKHRACTVPLPD